jgi:hypothetical protein
MNVPADVPADSPWQEHLDALARLVAGAKEVGLTVKVPDDVYYPDALLLYGDTEVCWTHYDPVEDAWATEDHSRAFNPLEDLLDFHKYGENKKPTLN